jgi:hypothetical protein
VLAHLSNLLWKNNAWDWEASEGKVATAGAAGGVVVAWETAAKAKSKIAAGETAAGEGTGGKAAAGEAAVGEAAAGEVVDTTRDTAAAFTTVVLKAAA